MELINIKTQLLIFNGKYVRLWNRIWNIDNFYFFSVSVGVFGILVATYIMYVRLKFKSSQRNEETPFHTLSIADEETYRLRCRLFGLEEEEIDTTTI